MKTGLWFFNKKSLWSKRKVRNQPPHLCTKTGVLNALLSAHSWSISGDVLRENRYHISILYMKILNEYETYCQHSPYKPIRASVTGAMPGRRNVKDSEDEDSLEPLLPPIPLCSWMCSITQTHNLMINTTSQQSTIINPPGKNPTCAHTNTAQPQTGQHPWKITPSNNLVPDPVVMKMF